MVTVPNRSNLWHLHLSRLLYSCCAIHHARSSSVSSPLLWVAIVAATFRLPRHLAASPTRLFHLLLLTLVWCLQMLSISSLLTVFDDATITIVIVLFYLLPPSPVPSFSPFGSASFDAATIIIGQGELNLQTAAILHHSRPNCSCFPSSGG